MADFTIDVDPYIPTGVAASPEQVAALVADGTLPADKVPDLTENQQPEDLKAAVLDAIAWNVSKTDAVVADYTSVLKDIGATKTEANAAVTAWGKAEEAAEVVAEPVKEEPPVEAVEL